MSALLQPPAAAISAAPNAGGSSRLLVVPPVGVEVTASPGPHRKQSPPRSGSPRKALADAGFSPLLSKLQSTHHQHQQQAQLHAQMSFSKLQGHAQGGGHLGTVGGTGRVRALEEYLEAFPVDKPSEASHLRVGDSDGEHAKAHKAPTAAEREMRRLEKENASRRLRTDAARATFENARKHRIDTWVQLAERNAKKLKKENEALAKVAQLTQENCINNDARYEETINALRAELEYTTLFRQDSAETLGYIWDAITAIQDRIVQMKTTGERQALADFVKVKEELETLLEEKAKDLEDVRQSGSNTTGEWVAKNRALQSELEKLLYQTDAAYTKNQELKAKHKQLQVEHDAQMTDGTVLEKQFHAASSHHQRLKDRIHDLELELATGGTSATSPEAEASQTLSDAQRGLQSTVGRPQTQASEASTQFSATLKKAQALLETEAENLRQVRAAHIQALKQRTELEVYLRQAVLFYVERHKESLLAEGYTSNSAMSIAGKFNSQDRRAVVERLLMKPRVLHLLYNEDAAAVRPPLEDEGPSGYSAADIDELWNKWKAWTTAADDAMRLEDPKRSSLDE